MKNSMKYLLPALGLVCSVPLLLVSPATADQTSGSKPASPNEHSKCNTKSGTNVTFPGDSHGGALFGSTVMCDDLGRYSIVNPRYIIGGKSYPFPQFARPNNEDFICQLAGDSKEISHSVYNKVSIGMNTPYVDGTLRIQTNNQGFNMAAIAAISCE
jgi:hypothetical protein